MEDSVECRSDTSYPERPVALTWQGTRREVDSILDRWRSPQGIHFRVRTIDRLVFELVYITASDVWLVKPT
jgi:hypothetical protein